MAVTYFWTTGEEIEAERIAKDLDARAREADGRPEDCSVMTQAAVKIRHLAKMLESYSALARTAPSVSIE